MDSVRGVFKTQPRAKKNIPRETETEERQGSGDLKKLIKEKTQERNGILRCRLGGEEFLFDLGAEISGRKTINPTGSKLIQLADGRIKKVPYETRDSVEFIQTPEPIIGLKDLVKCDKLYWLKEYNVKQQKEKLITESDSERKDELRKVLNLGSYAEHKNDCGNANKYKYEVKGLGPGVHKQYPLNSEAVKEVRGIIKELLIQGVLVEENHPQDLTPIQAVPKPDGSWRLVHNLKALNDVTVKDRRKKIDDGHLLETRTGGKWLSSLDLANGFWSIPITEKSSLKTDFQIEGKAYRWARLLQGFCNSPNVFQEA